MGPANPSTTCNLPSILDQASSAACVHSCDRDSTTSSVLASRPLACLTAPAWRRSPSRYNSPKCRRSGRAGGSTARVQASSGEGDAPRTRTQELVTRKYICIAYHCGLDNQPICSHPMKSFPSRSTLILHFVYCPLVQPCGEKCRHSPCNGVDGRRQSPSAHVPEKEW